MGDMAMQRVALDATQRARCGVAITLVPASGVPLTAMTIGEQYSTS